MEPCGGVGGGTKRDTNAVPSYVLLCAVTNAGSGLRGSMLCGLRILRDMEQLAPLRTFLRAGWCWYWRQCFDVSMYIDQNIRTCGEYLGSAC